MTKTIEIVTKVGFHLHNFFKDTNISSSESCKFELLIVLVILFSSKSTFVFFVEKMNRKPRIVAFMNQLSKENFPLGSMKRMLLSVKFFIRITQ